MKIKGRNIHVDTNYFDNTVDIDIDIDEMDLEEVVQHFGSTDLLNQMKIKEIVDFLHVTEILEEKQLSEFFENNEHEMMDYLIMNKGENWILDYIDDETIAKIHRDRSIDQLL